MACGRVSAPRAGRLFPMVGDHMSITHPVSVLIVEVSWYPLYHRVTYVGVSEILVSQ